MELGRLLSRLPASTVRLRLRVTLTIGVFLVGSHQDALGITKRARWPWREPFDDWISASVMMLGLVEAARTAQSRITHQDPDREWNWAQPIKHKPQAPLCTGNCTTTSTMLIMDSVVKVVSHVGIWTFPAE